MKVGADSLKSIAKLTYAWLDIVKDKGREHN